MISIPTLLYYVHASIFFVEKVYVIMKGIYGMLISIFFFHGEGGHDFWIAITDFVFFWPRFSDFQSRFLVYLLCFFWCSIHQIFRIRCQFPFFFVISNLRKGKTSKTSPFLTVHINTNLKKLKLILRRNLIVA